MDVIDIKINELKELQAELGHRHDVEKQAEELIVKGEFQKALELLKRI